MRELYPSYYPQFRCIAGDCRHSCCVGWEIDVDDAAMENYRKRPDILRHIDTSAEPAHFVLTEDERCPFLNGCGLCEIILRYGEGHLCQICGDHPRFRNFFDTHTEIGLGLCCEEAARLILTYPEKVTLPKIPSDDPFFADRARMFAILQNREVGLDERVREMLAICGAVLPEKSVTEWAAFFRSLECLDPARDAVLERVTDGAVLPEGLDVPTEQLLVYFVYRHLAPAVDDGMFAARVAFAVLSTRMVRAMAAVRMVDFSPVDALMDAARLYSSEVEYSEENLEEVLWLLDDAQIPE